MKKLIVMTGGSKGIGKAIVYKFAQEGFNIITCARNEKGLDELSTEITLSFPSIKIHVFKADLSKKEDIKSFIKFIESKTERVDVLINNTGVFIPGKISEEEEGTLEHLINTNLVSAYHLTKGLISKMIRERAGHIFNICSTASIMPYINGGSYCITKYALYGII